LRKKQEAREAEWKQYKDQMLEQSKTKERSFHFLLNAKGTKVFPFKLLLMTSHNTNTIWIDFFLL
jgi:hypothetical protein